MVTVIEFVTMVELTLMRDAVIMVKRAERPMPQIAREPEISYQRLDRLEPGTYSAYCRKAQTFRDRVYRRWICAVQFDVMSDDLLRVIGRVTLFLPLGSRERPHAGRRGKYWPTWVQANGCPPRRGDRLSPRVFEKRLARIAIRDVVTNHRDRKKRLQMEEFYSVVEEVKSWETGPGKPTNHTTKEGISYRPDG